MNERERRRARFANLSKPNHLLQLLDASRRNTMTTETKEAVNHPDHYNGHPSGVECITVVEHMGFNLGNAIKYIWRADLKADAIEDLNKACWYVTREIERRRGGKPASEAKHQPSAEAGWQGVGEMMRDVFKLQDPAPARVYPETRMEAHELKGPFAGYVVRADLGRAIANAALRHAIDAGQVALPFEAFLGTVNGGVIYGTKQDIERLKAQLDVARWKDEKNAAREMAIASRLRVEFRHAIARHHANLTDMRKAVDAIDLAAIIASVPT